jgi:hypothetical protein
LEAKISHGTRPSLAGVAASLGFRTIERVRVVVTVDGTTAQATGIVHRYPRTVPISLTAATLLAAAGAPLQVVDTTGRELSPAC